MFFMTAMKGDYTVFLQGPLQVATTQCKLEKQDSFLMRAGPEAHTNALGVLPSC